MDLIWVYKLNKSFFFPNLFGYGAYQSNEKQTKIVTNHFWTPFKTCSTGGNSCQHGKAGQKPMNHR